MPGPVYQFDDFELDCGRFELTRNGRPIPVERKPMELLILLAERNGQLLTRAEIVERLWQRDVFVDTEHGINTAIRKIRHTLRDDAEEPRFVQTVMGKGYRFVARVVVRGSEDAEAIRSDTDAVLPAAAAESTQISPEAAPSEESGNQARWRWLAWAIPGPLLAAVAVGLAAHFWIHRHEVPEANIRSLAVLPLDNLSGDPSQEYFADGMTDELITELARIPGLRVVSRTSVMQDKGARKSLPRIAQELGVDAIVEGSVVRSGDRVRITAQLIDARSDKHLWAQSFEGPLGDILSLQDSVAREISLRTSAVLTPAAKAELTNARHVNPDAYDAYLRGLYFIQRRDGDPAASYFRKAIALDPEYAAANAGLAEALVTQLLVKGPLAIDVMPSAIAAAKRAIELDPNSGEAYTALGAIDTNYLLDWSAAERNLRQGIELSPSSSDAETWFAVYLTSVGRPAEAVDAMRRAVALDPLSFWANRLLGSMLYYSRRYDESLIALQRAYELAPDKGAFVEGWNSDNYEMQGRYSEAFAADMKGAYSPADIKSFHAAFETGGWKGYQEARVKYLLPRYMNPCYMHYLAMSYVRLGKIDEAFRWFNRDVDNYCGMTVFDLSADPRLDKIREDPRFTALLHRVNLPH